jgi:hypothetical protein
MTDFDLSRLLHGGSVNHLLLFHRIVIVSIEERSVLSSGYLVSLHSVVFRIEDRKGICENNSCSYPSTNTYSNQI